MCTYRAGHVSRAQNADQAAGTCERFILKSKIMQFSDYQSTHLFVKFTRFLGFFFFIVSVRMLIGWVSKL